MKQEDESNSLTQKLHRENFWLGLGILVLSAWVLAEIVGGKDNYRLSIAFLFLLGYSFMVYIVAFKKHRCPKCGRNMKRLPLRWGVEERMFKNTYKFICPECGLKKDTHIGPSTSGA